MMCLEISLHFLRSHPIERSVSFCDRLREVRRLLGRNLEKTVQRHLHDMRIGINAARLSDRHQLIGRKGSQIGIKMRIIGCSEKNGAIAVDDAVDFLPCAKQFA